MNRNERADRKKQKRREKQRAARSRPVAGAPTPTGPRETFDQFLTRLADPAAESAISDALAQERTEASAIEAAVAASRAMDRTVMQAWAQVQAIPACSAGCSYCCRGVRVDVSIPEVAWAVAYARQRLSVDDLAAVQTRLAENAPRAHGTSVLEYPVRRACAFLGDAGQCLVYEARPLACRKEHSLDAAQCKMANDAQTLGSDTPVARSLPIVAAGGMSLLTSFRAFEKAGLPAGPYELQEAAHIALLNSQAVGDSAAGDHTVFARALAVTSGADLAALRRPQIAT